LSRCWRSRSTATPVAREILAGLVALAIGLFSLWLLTIGLGCCSSAWRQYRGNGTHAGVSCRDDRLWRVWLAVAFLFSVVFRAPATAALAALGVWLLFSLFWSVVTPLVATLIAGRPEGILGPTRLSADRQVLDRISPNTLYAEIASHCCSRRPRPRPVLYSQVQGALLGAPLPAAQSFILVWRR